MEITKAQVAEWNYYRRRIKNYPKVPKLVEKLTRKFRGKESVTVPQGLVRISFRSFLMRVENFHKDHLPNLTVRRFDPVYKPKE